MWPHPPPPPPRPYTAIVSPPAVVARGNRLLQGSRTTGVSVNPRYLKWESSTRPALPRPQPRPVTTTNQCRRNFPREHHRRHAQDLDLIQRVLMYQEENSRNWENGGIRSNRAMARELDDFEEI